MSFNDNTGSRVSEPPAWTWKDEHEDFAPSPPWSASSGSESAEDTEDRDRSEKGEVGDTGKGATLDPLLPAPYPLQQYAANIQPRNFLTEERRGAAGVLANPTLDDLIGHNISSVNFHDNPRSYSSGSDSLSDVPTHTTYSLAKTMPEHSMPIVMEIPDLYDQDELIPSQCFFKDILGTMCEERLRTREEFHNHMLDHFNGPPPKQALCIFCNLEFKKENPWSCWKEYLDHIRYQHFRNGMVIEQMRPDFVTWAYLRDTDVLPQARYTLICELANERKPSDYGWLRAANWVSPREEAKRLAEERQAEEENVVRIVERSTRRKYRDRSSRQAEKQDPQTCREEGSAYEKALGSPQPMFTPSEERNECGSSSNTEITKKYIQGNEQIPHHCELRRTTFSNLQQRQDSFHPQGIDPYSSLSLFDGPNQQPTRAEKGQAAQGPAATDQDKLPGAKLKEKYWPCVFKDIIQTPCDSKDLTNFEKWSNHSKTHPGLYANRSSTNSICLFCKKVFQEQDGNSFSERLDKSFKHMFHHLEEGADVDGIRCDDSTLEYLSSLGMLSEQRYAELKSLVENKSKGKRPCPSSDLCKEAKEQSPTDEHPAPNDPPAGNSIKLPALTPQNEALVRKQRRRKPWDFKSDDNEARKPLLARESSSSSSATSSNADWSHILEAPLAPATTTWDGYLEHKLVDADDSPSGSGAGTSNNGPTTATSQSVSNVIGTQPAEPAASSANGTAISSSTPPPPPSQPPQTPPSNSLGSRLAIKKTKLRRLLELLSCSEAIMFYIQIFQLFAISFQVACTTLYFASAPPPLPNTGRFSDSDYLSLLSTCLVQTIALSLSLIGMRRYGDENLRIWSVTVASMSFFLSVASLVGYFVYTTFGNLFMCLAAVCQLWIWKFVIFGARSGGEKGRGEEVGGGGDVEMQMTTTTRSFSR